MLEKSDGRVGKKMKWSELRSAWEADPEFRAAYSKEYPEHQVADALVALRRRLGLTQTELAGRVGSHQSVIARAESGKHPVRVDFLRRIAEAVGAEWDPSFRFPEDTVATAPVPRRAIVIGSSVVVKGSVAVNANRSLARASDYPMIDGHLRLRALIDEFDAGGEFITYGRRASAERIGPTEREHEKPRRQSTLALAS
jgi:transcriptional regulator with XRE-family HTH domain